MEKGVPTASLVCPAVSSSYPFPSLASSPFLSPSSFSSSSFCLYPSKAFQCLPHLAKGAYVICFPALLSLRCNGFLYFPAQVSLRCKGGDIYKVPFPRTFGQHACDVPTLSQISQTKQHLQCSVCFFLPWQSTKMRDGTWLGQPPVSQAKAAQLLFSQGFLALGFLPGVLPQSSGFWSSSPCVPVAVCPIPAWVEAIIGAGAQRTSSVSPC